MIVLIYAPASRASWQGYGVSFYLCVFFKKQTERSVFFGLVSKFFGVNPGFIFKLLFSLLRVTDTPSFRRKAELIGRLLRAAGMNKNRDVMKLLINQKLVA